MQRWQTVVSILVTGLLTAYAMIQPKMTPMELMLYGFTVVFRWVEMIVFVLIITWGYKFFKQKNNIK